MQPARRQALRAAWCILSPSSYLHEPVPPPQTRGVAAAAAAPGGGITMPSPMKLAELMQVDLLHDKTPDEVERIWLDFHSSQGEGGGLRIASTMGAEEYAQFATRARASPLFVVPIGKGGGAYVTMLLQAQLPLVAFTTLEEFRSMGPAAPPHVTLTHYAELAQSKGVVLVRGDVVNPAIASPSEARTLAELTRAFYTDPQAYQHVYKFNHHQSEFDFQALLRQLGHEAPAA